MDISNLTTRAKKSLIIIGIATLTACGGGNDDAPAANDNNTATPPSGNGSSSGQRSFSSSPDNNHIRPGVNVSSSNGSCTSNFLYYTDANNYYIGAAAHCFSPDTNDGIDPCNTGNAPIGSAVTIQNAEFPGTLAYSSWTAMQQNSETPGSAACVYNDFALVKIDERDLDNIHPAAFVFGGPTGQQSGSATVGTDVVSYGRSSLNFGVQTLQEKEGRIDRINGGGWNYSIRTDNPGVSGDSGSAVLRADNGHALGILVTVGVSVGIGGAVNNGVVNFERALNYAQPFISGNLKLETWSDFSR